MFPYFARLLRRRKMAEEATTRREVRTKVAAAKLSRSADDAQLAVDGWRALVRQADGILDPARRRMRG